MGVRVLTLLRPGTFFHALSLHAHHLPQRVHHLHQVRLRRHHSINGLIRRWRFVDYIRVLAAFHSFGHAPVIFHGEAPLGLAAGHRAPRAVAAAHETFRIAFPAHDIRLRSHAAGNYPHVSHLGAHGTFAGDKNVLAIVPLPRHIVVVAIDGLHVRGERPYFAGLAHRIND